MKIYALLLTVLFVGISCKEAQNSGSQESSFKFSGGTDVKVVKLETFILARSGEFGGDPIQTYCLKDKNNNYLQPTGFRRSELEESKLSSQDVEALISGQVVYLGPNEVKQLKNMHILTVDFDADPNSTDGVCP